MFARYRKDYKETTFPSKIEPVFLQNPIKTKHNTTMQVFKTVDTNETTLVYDREIPSSHKLWFLKTPDNQVWEERAYKGDAIFGGKSYFELLAEMNMSKSRLAKCGYTADEIGRRIYDGRVKLIKIMKGKQGFVELRWPEVCADDEKPWKNRCPKFEVVEKLEYEVLDENACDCDVCWEIRVFGE